MQDLLQLNLQVRERDVVECARFLRARLPETYWKIAAALAAEIVAIHEQATGSTVVVVTGADQAERVLRDLQRDQPALTPSV